MDVLRLFDIRLRCFGGRFVARFRFVCNANRWQFQREISTVSTISLHVAEGLLVVSASLCCCSHHQSMVSATVCIEALYLRRIFVADLPQLQEVFWSLFGSESFVALAWRFLVTRSRSLNVTVARKYLRLSDDIAPFVDRFGSRAI